MRVPCPAGGRSLCCLLRCLIGSDSHSRTVRHAQASRPPRSRGAAPAAPDIIFFNGVIYTGDGFAEDKPQTVQAIAIGGGKIIAVGTNEDDHAPRRTQHPPPRP